MGVIRKISDFIFTENYALFFALGIVVTIIAFLAQPEIGQSLTKGFVFIAKDCGAFFAGILAFFGGRFVFLAKKLEIKSKKNEDELNVNAIKITYINKLISAAQQTSEIGHLLEKKIITQASQIEPLISILKDQDEYSIKFLPENLQVFLLEAENYIRYYNRFIRQVIQIDNGFQIQGMREAFKKETDRTISRLIKKTHDINTTGKILRSQEINRIVEEYLD